MIEPTFPPVTMNIAITSVYRVMAVWVPVTVVPTSLATVAMDTFMTELSRVIRNCPAARVSRTSPVPLAAASAGLARPPPMPSGEGFGLQPIELRLVDRPRIQQLLGPGDLLGGRRLSSGGDVAHVALELLLGLLLSGRGPLAHPLAPNDQVDEHGQERQEHQEQHPQGLLHARHRVVAEQVGQDLEQDDEPDEQEEEPQHRPENVGKRDVGDDHGGLLGQVRAERDKHSTAVVIPPGARKGQICGWPVALTHSTIKQPRRTAEHHALPQTIPNG